MTDRIGTGFSHTVHYRLKTDHILSSILNWRLEEAKGCQTDGDFRPAEQPKFGTFQEREVIT